MKDILQVIDQVLELEGRAILDCRARLLTQKENGLALESALGLFQKSLASGGKIIVTGVGKSGKVAEKIAATLSSTGSLAVFVHPTDGLHGDLGVVQERDVVLALSQSGNTEELVRLAPSFQARKVPVVLISGKRESRLAPYTTVWIDSAVSQEACPYGLAPTTSSTLALALGDALAMALMKLRGFDPQAFAQNHPGGAIGNRLSLKVSDLMISSDKLGVVSPSDSMDRVLELLTSRNYGAVMVSEDGKRLSGIITDGDLKRALKARERLFSMKACEVMTAQPTTVGVSELAAHALTLMEDRPTQISILPVVNAQGNFVGLLRLHELTTLL